MSTISWQSNYISCYRCESKVLIVLSRNYESSDVCHFLTKWLHFMLQVWKQGADLSVQKLWVFVCLPYPDKIITFLFTGVTAGCWSFCPEIMRRRVSAISWQSNHISVYRCDSKVLIVLSRNYESSDACQFLTQFAVTLDPGRCLDLVCRGDGFFLACEDLGRMFDNSFSACAFFWCVCASSGD